MWGMIIQLPSTTRVTTPPAPSLLLPTFCVSATHAINLTKGITHISNTHIHTLSHVQGQSNKRCLPSCHALHYALGQLQREKEKESGEKETRKSCRSFANDI